MCARPCLTAAFSRCPRPLRTARARRSRVRRGQPNPGMSCEPCPALLPAINDLETMRALVCLWLPSTSWGEPACLGDAELPPPPAESGGVSMQGQLSPGPPWRGVLPGALCFPVGSESARHGACHGTHLGSPAVTWSGRGCRGRGSGGSPALSMLALLGGRWGDQLGLSFLAPGEPSCPRPGLHNHVQAPGAAVTAGEGNKSPTRVSKCAS